MVYYVEISGGNVVKGPFRLPRKGYNVSNLPALSESELQVKGIYPVQEIKPLYNPNTQQLVSGLPVLADGKVTRTWTAVDLDLDELKSAKTGQLRKAFDEYYDAHLDEQVRGLLTNFSDIPAVGEMKANYAAWECRITDYFSKKSVAIDAASGDELAEIVWDFEKFTDSKPEITIHNILKHTRR